MEELRAREQQFEPTQPASGQPKVPTQPMQAPQSSEPLSWGQRIWRAIAPELTAFILALIQILFLARFILKILALNGNTADWIPTIYTISDLFVWPFYLLWKLVPWQVPERIEVYTLAGLIILMLITRPIVRLLQARRRKLRQR
jgi:hypothetical protein